MKKGISLRIKTIILLVLVAFCIAVTSVVVSYRTYASDINSHYEKLAINISSAAATQMNGDKIKEYIDAVYRLDPGSDTYAQDIQSIKDEEYFRMLDILDDMMTAHQVMYLYVEEVSENGAMYILDPDPVAPCELGEVFPLQETNLQYLGQLDKGLPPFISNNTEYGWVCSAGSPIFDSEGNVVALACVDVSMVEVMHERHEFLAMIIALLSVTTVILVILFVLYINKIIVVPVRQLSMAASNFVSSKDTHKVSTFSKLKINTGDEIENLFDSVKQMEEDINEYINSLMSVTAEKERIGAELSVAKNIQASMLPSVFPPFPDHDDFDIYATMRPAKEVGGDFYDFFLIDNDHVVFIVADVSGKGVPAALFMIITKTLIKNFSLMGMAPEDVFTVTNTQLCENNKEGMFVTAWMGVYTISSGEFLYVNAGHNPPLLKRKDGQFSYVKSRAGFVLAGMEGVKYRVNKTKLEPGDTFFVYTDGVSEATDASETLYGEDRLLNTLNKYSSENPDISMEDLLKKVASNVDEFVGSAPQFDDITMLGFKVEHQKNNIRNIVVEAKDENLEKVLSFVREEAEKWEFSPKSVMQLEIAVEELFINISHYAYSEAENGGNAEIITEFDKEQESLSVTLKDNGKPYNPLLREDPDITLSAEERNIGGLGVYMTKKTMDDVSYEHRDNMNTLKIKKLKV